MFSFLPVLDRIAKLVRSGMAPLIRAVLSKHIGDKEANEIDIISNDVEIYPDGKWRIKYRHPSRWADASVFRWHDDRPPL